nr:sensor domain-containing diguanylate cyclase [uncultured Albidiferax sp.]
MIKPAIPPDEPFRLGTLRSLDLLDTPPEERFDRLTRMARRMFGVSIALVSLVDENRQWFKSAQGLEDKETSRDISFCGHAILGDTLLLVPDAKSDLRFFDNPLVTSPPYVRFYAGWPLRAANGSKLGTLCLLDPQPRRFADEDIQLLGDLAAIVEQEISTYQLATLDELTRLHNRRGFLALAQHALHLAARKALPCALVFFDLDKFKAINDNFGHAEGDKALLAFADQMRRSFRDADVLARLGGDEFVVLLFDCPPGLAQGIVERLLAALDRRNQFSSSGYSIVCSYGIVPVVSDTPLPIEALLSQADALMYQNKRRRNGS